jgi:hypothetical protein
MAKKRMDRMMNTEEEEFPGNSITSKVAPIREFYKPNDKPSIATTLDTTNDIPKKVSKPKAIRRRKSITRSIRETFVNEDSKNVFQYVIFEVLVPAAKTMIQEMVTQGIEMFLFGEAGGRSRNKGQTIVSYGDMYKRREEGRVAIRSSRRDRFGLQDIYFRKGEEASEILEALCEILDKYDQVTVADYFDVAAVEGSTWVHAKWGWENLKKAYCTHTRNGYAIVLPEPIELD